MRKGSDMWFLLVSLLYWNQTEGSCSGTIVGISVDQINNGEGFKLSCEFRCLKPQHVAQLWRDSRHEVVKDRVSLLNITSTLQDVILVLSISSATKADTGNYSCRTQPPDTISPFVLIDVANNVTTPSIPLCDRTQQHSSAAGLQSQIWYWILLGKTAILLLSLASLAVKYRKG